MRDITEFKRNVDEYFRHNGRSLRDRIFEYVANEVDGLTPKEIRRWYTPSAKTSKYAEPAASVVQELIESRRRDDDPELHERLCSDWPLVEYLEGREFIEYFREKLLVLRHNLMVDLGMEAPETPQTADDIERATMRTELELYFQTTESDSERLGLVDEALKKIADGSYGKCEADDKPIPLSRLEAYPYARLCVPHKEQFEFHQEHGTRTKKTDWPEDPPDEDKLNIRKLGRVRLGQK